MQSVITELQIDFAFDSKGHIQEHKCMCIWWNGDTSSWTVHFQAIIQFGWIEKKVEEMAGIVAPTIMTKPFFYT